ncbi:hypothetical protein T12_6920 [Trichinella patagoniensis]|uniref:Uncharacterized protein n=1 Tax=Trichinella patagoniensis TaxID=990121 RepID=A0A0V0ZX75_9BILA|nr:hypothetical protein T12_6920 [Trichinella patagoniensis]
MKTINCSLFFKVLLTKGVRMGKQNFESSPTLCKSPYCKMCLTKYTGIFALLCFKWKLTIENFLHSAIQ